MTAAELPGAKAWELLKSLPRTIGLATVTNLKISDGTAAAIRLNAPLSTVKSKEQ